MAQFHSIVQSNGPPPTLSGSRISTQQHHIQQQPGMINTSFNGNQQVDSNMTTGLLKISNLPPDLTRREATLIFALVIEEMLSIEIKDYQIYAVFKTSILALLLENYSMVSTYLVLITLLLKLNTKIAHCWDHQQTFLAHNLHLIH